MTTWGGRLVPLPRDGEDADVAARLESFRLAHKDIPVLARRRNPAAWIGQERVAAPTLAELLDILGRRFPARG